MKITEYNVMSPDKFTITQEWYATEELAKEAYDQWKKRFEHQGYYSSNKGRISLSELDGEIMPTKRIVQKYVLLNQCDVWKDYTSFRLVGVFTDRDDLNNVIIKLHKASAIKFDGNISDINEMSLEELYDACMHLHFNEIELNEDYL